MRIGRRMQKSQFDRIVQRAQSGNGTAFEAIVRAYEKPIRAWATMHCPPGGDADDIAQCTFIAAFRRLADFEVGTNFEAWLFAIARYQLMTEMNRLRRLADYRSRFAPELINRELTRRAEQAPSSFEGERLTWLDECLQKLTPDSRMLLDWRYDEQISVAEMAERSNRSTPAIKKALFVLRRTLRRCIEQKASATEAIL